MRIWTLTLACAVVFAGCDRRTEPVPTARAEAEHAGHDHGDEDASLLSLDELEQASCEHDTKTWQCDNCRYELGVVQVEDALIRADCEAADGLVCTESVAREGVIGSLTVTGEVRLNENRAAHISPSIPGIIESVAVDIGAQVRKGDALFTLRSVELGRSISDYERGGALTALSLRSLERERSLFERRISSEQEVIEAQMAWERNKTELQAAEQTLRVLGLSDQDLFELARAASAGEPGVLVVRAPIAGTVVERHAVVGELVDPGTAVMLVADFSDVWVWADVYERDLARLLEARKLGAATVDVAVAAYEGRSFPGSIDYVAALMDEHTRTVKIRATVKNSDGLLRPGMFCETHIGLSESGEAIVLPRAAVLSDEGQSFVFAHWKDDYWVRRLVTTGRTLARGVEITAGLEPGQMVVTEGAFLLKSDVLREKMGAGCAD